MAKAPSSKIGDAAHAAGFTLVELLVVLALIGLLTLAAPALLSAARPGVDAKATALAVASDLRAIRQAALASGQPQDFVIDPASRVYQLQDSGRARTLPPGLALEIVNTSLAGEGPPTRISFFPDGSSSGGHIQVRSDRKAYRVSVDWLSGKVSLDD